MSFNRYQIPPNFDICQIHQKASLIYDQVRPDLKRCPCCDRAIGITSIPFCRSSEKLLKICEQLPLYFSFIKVIMFVIIVFSFALLGEYIFSRNYQILKFNLLLPSLQVIVLQIGFIEKTRSARFCTFLLFTALIIVARAYLKKKNYQAAFIKNRLSDRSLMFTNVHPRATVADIKRQFEGQGIQNVVLTFKVKNYRNCLVKIYNLQKQRIIAQKNGLSRQKILKIQAQINETLVFAQEVFRTFRTVSNKLEFVFVTFTSQAKRDVFLKKHSTSLLGRLFYKFCTCCSSTAIYGRHINVLMAPQPEDIDWLNLEQSYWTKKLHRMSCFYICLGILIYGVLFQYQLSMDISNFSKSIKKTGVIFVVNYLIITLFDSTTYEIEKHELNTNKMLSLTKKLTFFIFINLSMSPLAVYFYYTFSKAEPPGKTNSFDNLVFSVLTICIAQSLNFQRIRRSVLYYYQKSKGMKCQMTQQQANYAFQPIPFPLAAFYSLFISSFLMISFFVSSFQVLILIELISCFVIYYVSKYMLLKVCKQPTGLKNQVSILCQRILTTSIYIYWIGDKVMHYCIVDKQHMSVSEYIQQFTTFDIIEIVIILFIMFFSSKLLSLLSHTVAENEDINFSLLQQVQKNANLINSYEEVNAIKKLEESYKHILSAY